ncbi:glutamate--tRNA ligase [Methanohalophilus sp.]|uniref:glutamate--tRNA ligase n=1 Tax=Methanohalophilus sp. TaxID=1966352 RepID=UPI00260B1815|nr:glutamate--tRNA ligase [Methanohalophilus sp.]MDK2892735.1 glutamyl-tRNA synthetase [Methanohalophilus sp.]
MTLTKDDIKTIEKFAFQNAVKYGQAPQVGAVMGKVMGTCPHLRQHAKDVSAAVKNVVEEVAAGTPEQWQARLEELAPELIEELNTKKESNKGLKPLDVEEGQKVVMRFAPNPNGPATLGSARGIVINSEYVKKYGGTFIIRFDDTDPQTKRPMLKAYDWYLDDCEWLGAKPDRVVIASDRMPLYYEYAEKLIEMGKAYVCFCTAEEFKKFKDSSTPCPHRELPSEEHLKHWHKMLEGEYEDRTAVLRIKTDIQHKDPALRDFGAFRIVKTPHPRKEIGDKYVVWPLLDFEGAIEDHELGMTHIIRGKDLMDSEKRQKYIYDYFGWEYPKTTHWGRIKIHEFGKFSTSSLRKAIEEGVYSGWDDPRLPTLRALRRRGILPQAIRKFMIEMGVGETDVSISMESLYAENRKLIDPIANRYFFVPEPVEMQIENSEACVAKPRLHPIEDRGYRTIKVGSMVYVSGNDAEGLKEGDRVRLKDLFNVEVVSINPFVAKYIGDSVEEIKKSRLPIIQWVGEEYVRVEVRSPDGIIDGYGEPDIANQVDVMVQFERFGFCRIESVKDKNVVAYFAHK